MAQYYTQIDANPNFSLRYVSPLVKEAIRQQKTIELKGIMEIGNITYSVGFNPQRMRLTLRWEEYGEEQRQSIGVVAEPSNIRLLSGSYVYYFLCPHTGAKCRILYKTIGGGFCSRKALKQALYPIQMESKKFRYIHYPPEEKAPYRRNGKEYYRGKLTPYGKKCRRWEAAIERKQEAFMIGVSKLLNSKI